MKKFKLKWSRAVEEAQEQHRQAKAKNTWQTLRRLGKYLFARRGMMAVAVVLSIGSNLFALLGPTLSGKAIDAIELGAGHVNFERVFYYCILMLFFYLISAGMSYILHAIMLRITKDIGYQLRQEVFEKLLSLPVGYFDRHATGEIISRINYDVSNVNASISQDLIVICSSIVVVVGSLISMLLIEPLLVLVFAVTVPISLLLTKKITAITKPMFRRRSRKLGELNALSEELITGQKTLKAYHQEENTKDKFAAMNKEAIDAYYQADYYGAMVGPCVNFINNLSMALISVFGALMYLYHRISLGDISAFVLYSRKFSGPINETANMMSELQSAMAAAERIFQLLDEDPETMDVANAVEMKDTEGAVVLKEVSFGYDPGQTVLHNLNLNVKPGSQIAVVGPTGAGKTTLINLLMRFYDVNAGEITIDGIPIREMTRASLRGLYAMVLQDTWLFQGSIYENIAYGKEDATKEEVIEAAKMAGIHSYIMQLPEGYETILTDEGTNISKGQKQLMTIARAILLDAKMLILDEATSNVDTRTELKIQNAMTNLMQGKTCFIIAHRLSTIRNADLILVVRDGDIVEQGRHKELLAQKGFYYQLYHAQFEEA